MDYIINKGRLMKRAAIFAHYDKDAIIDDYVIFYLKALKEVCSKIIFVSCGTLLNAERLKLDGIADYIIAETHNEYDFGSYKRGFIFLKNNDIQEFDEIVFANDSCYGPFYPLKDIFSEMENGDTDFWGITKNNFGYKKSLRRLFVKRPHIQSYFFVVAKKVFLSNEFYDFMNGIKEENSKKAVISKYEIGLTELISSLGFKYDAYIKGYGRINNVTVLKWRQIIEKEKMPFLKCSVPRLINRENTTASCYQQVIKRHSDYPLDIIENNVLRTKKYDFSKCSAPVNVKRFIFDILGEMPFVIRKPISLFIQKCLPYFID